MHRIRKLLKTEFILEEDWQGKYKNPLEAALANPDLLSENSTLYPEQNYDLTIERRFNLMAAREALGLLEGEDLMYINHFLNQMSVRAIARAMNVPKTTAQDRLHRAIQHLRALTEKILQERG